MSFFFDIFQNFHYHLSSVMVSSFCSIFHFLHLWLSRFCDFLGGFFLALSVFFVVFLSLFSTFCQFSSCFIVWVWTSGTAHWHKVLYANDLCCMQMSRVTPHLTKLWSTVETHQGRTKTTTDPVTLCYFSPLMLSGRLFTELPEACGQAAMLDRLELQQLTSDFPTNPSSPLTKRHTHWQKDTLLA